MPKILTLITIGIIFFVHLAGCWEIAVTIGDRVEFFNADGSGAGGLSHQFMKLSEITYDSVHDTLYFSDAEHENVTIFTYKMDDGNIEHVVKKSVSAKIDSIAFDPVSNKLYWIESTTRNIKWMTLLNNDNGVLVQMKDSEKPFSIAIDSCRRALYWTDGNYRRPKIEKVNIDNNKRETLFESDIKTPQAITVDQETKRIYWIEDSADNEFKIKSSSLDGKDMKTVYTGSYQSPYDLVVNNGYFFWTERNSKAIWRLPMNTTDKIPPVSIKNFTDKSPVGITARVNLLKQTKGVKECENLQNNTDKVLTNSDKNFISNAPKSFNIYDFYCLNGFRNHMEASTGNLLCECNPGYTGVRCEISLCHNYCMNGTCSLDERGQPICRCDSGFYGERCTSSVCDGFCLNGGTCKAIDGSQPTCSCLPGWRGDRCESSTVTETTTICSRCDENDTSDTVPDLKSTKSVDEDQSLSFRTDPKVGIDKTEKPSEDVTKVYDFNNNVVESIDLEHLTVDDGKCVEQDEKFYIIIFLSLLSFTCTFVIVILVRKIVVLQKRPRIKKRFIVNQSGTPLTTRPNTYEITIENCCNMNSCETPCFEPENLQAQIADMNQKEEKSNLLLNMEHHY